MLKSYAVSEPSRWDKHLPYVLFAYREVPNETTGFSPYGRQVRGPLSILKENWEEPEEASTSVISYLLETRERIKQCSELARVSEQKAKQRQKVYYDVKSRNRSLDVGQKVHVLLPSSSSKLLAQWKGPYEVVEKVGPVDYRIRIRKGKEKVFHVNMLKQWFDRNDKSDEILACLDVIQGMSDESELDVELSYKSTPTLVAKEGVSDV